MSKANAPRQAKPLPDEAVPGQAFSDFVDDEAGLRVEDELPDEAPGDFKFTEWLRDVPVSTDYHEHVGKDVPLGIPAARRPNGGGS